jgi:hypothetical protein
VLNLTLHTSYSKSGSGALPIWPPPFGVAKNMASPETRTAHRSGRNDSNVRLSCVLSRLPSKASCNNYVQIDSQKVQQKQRTGRIFVHHFQCSCITQYVWQLPCRINQAHRTVRMLKHLLTVRCSRLSTQPLAHGPRSRCLAPRNSRTSGTEAESKRNPVPSMISTSFLEKRILQLRRIG